MVANQPRIRSGRLRQPECQPDTQAVTVSAQPTMKIYLTAWDWMARWQVVTCKLDSRAEHTMVAVSHVLFVAVRAAIFTFHLHGAACIFWCIKLLCA